jgi:hypothetical protein
MLVCPIAVKEGGRTEIGEKEANVLEDFVAKGGILILVANSMDFHTDIAVEGLNAIAKRFGLRFAANATDTLLIPIKNDDPVFSDVRNIVYGNGTIIEPLPGTGYDASVLVESNNPKVPGAVAIRVRFKKGTVLALGDAGILGNAYALRSGIDQAQALAQMMHCLLPEGPLRRYGWQSGLQLKIKLWHQEIISGYPAELRLFDLPRDGRTKYVEAPIREIDRQAAHSSASGDSGLRGFASAMADWKTEVDLKVGAFDGRAYEATWTDEKGGQLISRLTPRGNVLNLGLGAPELASWRWALAGEIIMAPLDPVAQVGDVWGRKTLVPLPDAQLGEAPRIREAESTIKFEGVEDCLGKHCYVLSKTAMVEMPQMTPQDLVHSAYSDYFDSKDIRLTSTGQVLFVKTWIDQESLLPIKTELRSASTFWWEDERQPDMFLSTHDVMRIYENINTVRHVVSFGRVLTAEFEVQ